MDRKSVVIDIAKNAIAIHEAMYKLINSSTGKLRMDELLAMASIKKGRGLYSLSEFCGHKGSAKATIASLLRKKFIVRVAGNYEFTEAGKTAYEQSVDLFIRYRASFTAGLSDEDLKTYAELTIKQRKMAGDTLPPDFKD